MSEEIINKLQEVFSICGIPVIIVSYNRSQLVSTEFKNCLRNTGSKQINVFLTRNFFGSFLQNCNKVSLLLILELVVDTVCLILFFQESTFQLCYTVEDKLVKNEHLKSHRALSQSIKNERF